MQTDIDKEKSKQVFQMEWRQCPGCPQEFKVLTSSPQVYHSRTCETLHGGKVSKPIKKKQPWESYERDQKKHGAGVTHVDPPSPAYEPPRAKPLELQIETVNERSEAVPAVMQTEVDSSVPVTYEPPKEQKEPEPLLKTPAFDPAIKIEAVSEEKKDSESGDLHRAAIEKKWRFYVEQGQQVVSRIGKDRLEIAALAIEACDIRHGGGGHWSEFEGIYTMKRYAEEVGICYKTLANWVRVKRNVFDKLIEIKHPVDPMKDWSAMVKVADKCDIDHTPEQVLKKFLKWDKKGPFNPERYFLQGLRRMRSLNYYLTTHDPSKKTFEDEDLKELKTLARSIIKWCDK